MRHPALAVWRGNVPGGHDGEAIPWDGTPSQSLAKQYIRYEISPLCSAR
jgi:hypothetical protein